MGVVTLCGSVRFSDVLARLAAELTAEGHTVLAPVVPAATGDLTDAERTRLGQAHLDKVAAADEVLVVDPGGYVGESTRREIAHARSLGIPVTFLEPPSDPL